MQKSTAPIQALSTLFGILLAVLLFSIPAHAAGVQDFLQGEMRGLQLSPSAQPLADVPFRDADNQKVKLSDFRGRVVLLTIWATWCPYCAKEMPTLSDLQAAVGADKLAVLPIAIDKEGARVVKKYLEEKSLNLPTYVDPKTEISMAYETHGIPYSIVIDKQGREVGRIHGETNWNAPESVALINYLTQQ